MGDQDRWRKNKSQETVCNQHELMMMIMMMMMMKECVGLITEMKNSSSSEKKISEQLMNVYCIVVFFRLTFKAK